MHIPWDASWTRCQQIRNSNARLEGSAEALRKPGEDDKEEVPPLDIEEDIYGMCIVRARTQPYGRVDRRGMAL